MLETTTIPNTKNRFTEPTDLELQMIEDKTSDNIEELEEDFKNICQYSDKEARAAVRQVQLEDEKYFC